MSFGRVRGYLSVCLFNISLCQVFLSKWLVGCQRACVDGSVKDSPTERRKTERRMTERRMTERRMTERRMTERRKTQRRKTQRWKTQRRKTQRRMTKHRKTLSRKIPNTEWPNAELDKTSKMRWIFTLIIIIYSNFPAAASYYDITVRLG